MTIDRPNDLEPAEIAGFSEPPRNPELNRALDELNAAIARIEVKGGARTQLARAFRDGAAAFAGDGNQLARLARLAELHTKPRCADADLPPAHPLPDGLPEVETFLRLTQQIRDRQKLLNLGPSHYLLGLQRIVNRLLFDPNHPIDTDLAQLAAINEELTRYVAEMNQPTPTTEVVSSVAPPLSVLRAGGNPPVAEINESKNQPPLSPKSRELPIDFPHIFRQSLHTTIGDRAVTLQPFGGSKANQITARSGGSEGGVVFYEDAASGKRYALKFFKGEIYTQRKTALRHLESGNIDADDLNALSLGFPMATWLGQLNESHFLPLESTGIITSSLTGQIMANPSAKDQKTALEFASKQLFPIPYMLTPFLQQSTDPSTLEATHEYREYIPDEIAHALRVMSTEDQHQLAPEFQEHDAATINQIIREKVRAIIRTTAQQYGIGLNDHEVYVNLRTGSVKLLDLGVSIPLEQPHHDFLRYLQALYQLTGEQIATLATANQRRTQIENFYARYPHIPRPNLEESPLSS